ncbi:hypothetical protein MJO29_016653 [Puccinia striiformis f. sp. tritici]|nr:hypothetical protein MJO29_016653 [Puccinia striiformis f. sp. tritici]
MLLVLAIIALIAFPSGLLASSPQFCGKYFAPSPKVPGHHDCDNPALKPYRCRTDSCGDDHSSPSLRRTISMPLILIV